MTFCNKKNLLFFLLFVIVISSFFAQQKVDALELYLSGKYSEAITVCQGELQQNPKNLDSYTVLCWSLVKNRQYAEAGQWANRGLAVNPNDHRLIEILGEAKFYLG